LAEFGIRIEGTVRAKNIESANSKAKELQEWMEKKGWEWSEVSVKGLPAPK